jgi:hypothetical protein
MDDPSELGLAIREFIPCHLARLIKINIASTQPIWLGNQTFLFLNSNETIIMQTWGSTTN